MKCIKIYRPYRKSDDKTGIHRVSDHEAYLRVQSGSAVYIPKSEWKKKVRDA